MFSPRLSKTVNGVTLWQCTKCNEFYPREGFYKDNRTPLGLQCKCRKCHSQNCVQTRDPELHAASDRNYAKRARKKDPEKFRQRKRQASKKRPRTEKVIARSKLSDAVWSGKISRPNECQECKKTGRVSGHHHDYSKPFDVEWLCYECHGKRHRKYKQIP